MLQIIIDYLKINPKFTWTLTITLVACAIIITLICFFYKKRKSNITNESRDISQIDEEIPENKINTCDSSEKVSEQGVTPIDYEETCSEEEAESEEVVVEDSPTATEEEVVKNTSQNQTQLKSESENSIKYAGKWLIYEEDGRFFAELKASNGELMLRSESYSSLSGVKSGIITLKKNIEIDNYAISLDKNGNFFFKIFSTAKRLLCVGEAYATREQCEKAFASVKRFSKTAKIFIKK